MIEFGEARKTIGQHMLADGMNPVIDLEKSHGAWLADGRTGKEYLDLFQCMRQCLSDIIILMFLKIKSA